MRRSRTPVRYRAAPPTKATGRAKLTRRSGLQHQYAVRQGETHRATPGNYESHERESPCLQLRRVKLVGEMRALAERAVTENRDMSADENEQFDKLNAEVDGLEKRAKAILEGEQRAK